MDSAIEERPGAIGRGGETRATAGAAPGGLFVERLRLTDFRSIAFADLSLRPGPVLLIGPNGSGKTHILEAISLLIPGRGLRRAQLADITRRGSNAPAGWAVAATLGGAGGALRIGTGLSKDTLGRDRRAFRLDGEAAHSKDLARHLRLVWLTPAMDRLLEDGKEGRRSFFDHLVAGFDRAHTARLTRYDRARAERLKILVEAESASSSWLDGLERAMAKEAVAITAARAELLARLRSEIAVGGPLAAEGLFPRAQLDLEGGLEKALEEQSPADVERAFAAELAAQRARDAAAHKTLAGPHRSNLRVRHTAKDMPAELCSTGEQKALLLNIVLSHVHLIAVEFGAPPIVLLDAIAAHLDDARRAVLFAGLKEAGAQVFMTGADLSPFGAMRDRAQVFEMAGGQLRAPQQDSNSGLQDR
jgi:DNA replication and repair protein RecF